MQRLTPLLRQQFVAEAGGRYAHAQQGNNLELQQDGAPVHDAMQTQDLKWLDEHCPIAPDEWNVVVCILITPTATTIDDWLELSGSNIHVTCKRLSTV